MRRFALCFALLFAGSTVACDGEPLGPRAIAGDYGLAQVNGQSLPYLLPPLPGNSVSCNSWLMAGTLSMHVAGTYAIVLNYRDQCTPDSPVFDFENSSQGSYSLNGPNLTFTPDTRDPVTFTGSVSTGPVIVIFLESSRYDLELTYSRSD